MRLTHISPEFIYKKVYGTYAMKEKKSFFSSKLIKFDSNISILNENLVYYESANHEQTNLNAEVLLGPVIYDTTNDKYINSSLELNKSQTDTQLNTNTSWMLTINYGTILQNYLFATLKKWRTFEGVANNTTLNNDIDYAINEYIKDNLLALYDLSKIELFISYNNILTNNPPLLVRNNTFDVNVANNSNQLTKFNSNINKDTLADVITFSQEKTSKEYNFNYYYNLYFTKI